jgi:hypothetical protein
MAAVSLASKQEIMTGFTRVVRIEDFSESQGIPPAEQGRLLCSELEIGNLLLLDTTPFAIPEEDREVLLGRRQVTSAYHKNIAYRPLEDRVTGLEGSEQKESDHFRQILRRYSQQVVQFLNQVLVPYRDRWKLDYASFRPIEENGRNLRLHARNDLLHFDSFPTRATNGARILRVFTNINPIQNRVWLTSQAFEAFGPKFARAAGIESIKKSNFAGGLLRSLASALHLSAANRPPYDEIMHRCHNAMKEDAEFQETTPKNRWEFPPNSSWLAFTDCVSHAVLAGQYALEQTFLIPQTALVERGRSPLAILERVAGHSLTI